ncbi:MAG TPA: hypothetical protein VFV38_10665 [Ktedonobacteraceae bacterium]|nr:hypothetical protein [Ktedonobacteraceae bacterium]
MAKLLVEMAEASAPPLSGGFPVAAWSRTARYPPATRSWLLQ